MDLSKIKVGQVVCYHTGNLVWDRVDDKALDKLADEFYNCSTFESEFDKKKGTGEFLLFQNKLLENKYQYLAKRIRPAKVVRKLDRGFPIFR